jgi:hypothetical protein
MHRFDMAAKNNNKVIKIRLTAVYIFMSFFCVFSASAQTPVEDSLQYQASLQKTLAVYYNQLEDQSFQ